MEVKIIRVNILLIAIVAVSLSCVEKFVQGTGETVLLFTGNVNGEIDPCGWESSPSGGLARKATYIASLREKNSSVLVFDTGDLFMKGDDFQLVDENEKRARAGLILDAFNEMGMTAMTIGEGDYSLGEEFLLSLRDRANFDFLSANLYDINSGLAIFKEYSIVESGGLTIGIFGLAWDTGTFPPGIEIQDPYMTATRIVGILRDKVDLIIALTHMSSFHDRAIADSIGGIDFIFGGHDGDTYGKPVKVGNTRIMKSGIDGMSIGKVEVSISESGGDLTDLTDNVFEIRYIDRMLLTLDQALARTSQEESQKQYTKITARIEELKSKRNKLIRTNSLERKTMSYDLVSMTVEYSEDIIISEMVGKFKEHYPKVEPESEEAENFHED